MKKLQARKTLLSAAITLIIAGAANQAFGSSFQLAEESGVGVGNYNAGAGAIAEDASTAYYNPAGLTLIGKPQLVTAFVAAFIKINYAGTNTWTAPMTPFAGLAYTESGVARGGKNIVIPAIHFVMPLLNDRLALGFSVDVPFGLATKWDQDSVLRYDGTKSTLTDIDYSPTIAYAVTKKLSIGVGLDVQYLRAELDSVVGIPLLALTTFSAPANTFDGISINKANGWGTGWHAGILYQFSPATRIGATYHAETRIKVDGNSTFSFFPTPGTLPFGSASSSSLNARAVLPASADLSAYHDMNDEWAVMASLDYTWWHADDIVVLNNVAAFISPPFGPGPFLTTASLPLNYHNTWRGALGTQVKLTDNFLIRMGTGFETTPTVDAARDNRIPDGNRIAAAIGAHYQVNKLLGVDLGWTHLFVRNGDLNASTISGTQVSTPHGTTTNSANLLGVQVNWTFC